MTQLKTWENSDNFDKDTELLIKNKRGSNNIPFPIENTWNKFIAKESDTILLIV